MFYQRKLLQNKNVLWVRAAVDLRGQAAVEDPDDLQGLLLLSRGMLELEEHGQSLASHAQGGEDGDRFRDRLLEAVGPTQLYINPCEVKRHHGDLMCQISFHEAFARLQERGLSGIEMPEVPEELTLLPAGPEEDEVVVELLVEVTSFEI